MKAVINPQNGVWKKLTEEQYLRDKKFIHADGFRLMTEKEIEKYLKVKPTVNKKSPVKKKTDEKND